MSNKLLLIGIDKYHHHKKLATCVKDVTDFRDILLEKFDFIESEMYELLNENATNRSIQDTLSGLCQTLSIEDNLIMFFSGHGAFSAEEERGFWIPVDATNDYTTWLPNETIIAFIQKMRCRHIFLISDSCFSNSLLLQENPKSLKEYNKRASRWALTSAYDESYSPKDPDSNSLFAESIIEFLEESDSDFRISTLIEYVKTNFTGNVLQTPQGYPIKVNGHKGGELILTIQNDIDSRALKGYGDFRNVLKLYKRTANFEEVSTYEDKTHKIGFQLFNELDPIVKRLTYYLYLYSGIVQTQTLSFLKANHPTIFGNSILIIFLPKELSQIDVERRKINVKSKFKPTNIFYIDEFIRTSCTPSLNESSDNRQFLQISNFILPSYYNSTYDNIESHIEKWQYSLSEPILVIKGSGGIGKTTFAQYVVDSIISKSPYTSVLFIDSVRIKDNLIRRNKYVEHLSIYNFYEALFNHDDSTEEKLTEEIFRLNLDAGNILLVIDGLDEVISKIPSFDVNAFLHSIMETSNELGGGKVLITCRSHFWNQANIEKSLFEVIELKPFDKIQTTEFFAKCFESDRKQKKALKLANEFKFSDPENENVYHPYVLDIIRSIIELESDSLELDLTEFSSSILNNTVKNDYIIYRVCDRERKRIGQISIDEQISFFIYLANERRGNIQISNLKKEFENALSKQVDDINIEAFKSHPFLQKIGNTITFRYDFFAEIFKGIYLANIFNLKNESSYLSKSFQDIVNESCWFGSNLNTEIVKRIDEWTEDNLLLVSEIVEYISGNQEIGIDIKREINANVFSIAILTHHKFNSNDIQSNTFLLKAIFENPKNQIKNLSVISLNTDKTLRFDFSGLQIDQAYIDGYNSFYECSFNEHTRFQNSHILNIDSKTKNKQLPNSIFINCIYDKNIADSISEYNEMQKSSIDRAKLFLNSFLHLFYSNGRLGRQWEEKVIKPRFKGVDKYNYGYKKVIRILKRHEVLISANEKEGVKLFVTDKYKGDVVRFVKDGTISKIISELIKIFSEL